MKVVIVGPRDRKEQVYRKLVNEIIDQCRLDYPKLVIVTKSCDAGVGKIIRTRCLPVDQVTGSTLNKPEFDMVEYSVRHYLIQELPQSEFQTNFDSLNGPLVEVGDEFHVIIESMIKGGIGDLIERLDKSGRPYVTYGPHELQSGPKRINHTNPPPLTPNAV